jgi:hypothetical protein
VSTQILENAYERIDINRDIVFRFFAMFSLFEYALKNAGFWKSSKKGVEADWEKFALEIEDTFIAQVYFDPNSELHRAVEYILCDPPRKQIIRNDQLEFKLRTRPDNVSDTVWLTVLIRGIRNNLFHGGKFRYDHERDTILIRDSIIILEDWAGEQERVRNILQIIF